MQKKGNLTCSKNYTEIESVIKKVKMKIKFLYKQPSICVKTNKNNFTDHPLTNLKKEIITSMNSFNNYLMNK